MPTKRTKDSVDQILRELSSEQAERDIRTGVTDRQVDAILQSIGMDPHGSSAGQDTGLGPIQKEDLPDVKLNAGDGPAADRFSTTILDDLLGDLPSFRATKTKQAPVRPASRKLTPEEQNVKKEETIQNVNRTSAQPAPAAPRSDAPQRSSTPAKQPAPAPQPTPVREEAAPQTPLPADAEAGDTTRTSIIKGFLKKMSADGGADTEALNVGKEQFQNFFEKSAAVVPDEKGHLRDPGRKKKGIFGLSSAADTGEFTPINFSYRNETPAQDAMEQEEPERPVKEKKPGLFQRMFGSHKERDEEIQDAEDAGILTGQTEEAVPPQEDTEEHPGIAFDLPDDDQAEPDEPESSQTFEPQSEPRPMPSAEPVPEPAPRAPEPTSTIYRKKRDTVEFTPRKQREKKFPRPEPPRSRTEPVGEPVMTPTEQVTPRQEPRAEDTVTGFTQELQGDQAAEDTASFLAGLGIAAPQRKASARTAAPEPDSHAGDTFEELPREVAQTLTGQVRLTEIADGVEQTAPRSEPASSHEDTDLDVILGPQVEEKPDTAEFVRSIEESINIEPQRGAEEDRFDKAARILTNPESEEVPEAAPRPAKSRRTRLAGTPEDESVPGGEAPFADSPDESAHRHEYESAEDAPAVRKELDNRVLWHTIAAVVSAAAAAVMIYLGTAAASSSIPLPAALDPAAGCAALMVTMLILLAVCCALCWQTLVHGIVGLFNLKKGATADTMPALAALAAAAQCIAFLARPEWYNETKLCLMAGPAALLLFGNALGKMMDAKTVRDNFALVSAGVDHAVAYRLRDSAVLRTVTNGLAEPRPNVLVSRPTRLLKGFLAGSAAKGTSDRNQQQFARLVAGASLAAFVFTLLYRRDGGMAVSVLAAMLCLCAPVASTLISAVPRRLMQRSAAQIGAVIPGWKDIRQLGRVNVLQVTARDLFPKGCIALCGIKPVRKEDIDLAIIYSASMLAGADTPLRDVFLSMTGDNRKLLCKVDDFETVNGMGYVGWINGERVLIGSRRLMDRYDVKLPSMEYERRHTVNQRRVIYLAVSGNLFSMFQVSYQSDPDTAAVLETLRRSGLSLIVDCDDFNCDEALLQTAYNLPVGTVKVLSGKERAALEPAVAWLPESEGNMLHLGSFASFVGGLEAAAGAAEGEHKASTVLTCSVLIGCVLALIMALAGGLTSLPLPAVALYQAAWAVMALVFPMIQRY